jgi:hypothetical protein
VVKLAGKLAAGNVELEQAMAGRQRHAVHVARIPGRYDMAARVRVVLQAIHQLADLVNQALIGGFPAPPLLAIDRAEIAIFIGPFVPYADTICLQIVDVGVALQEPQQFMNDGFQVQLLGCHHRKTMGEVEAHLPAEDRAGASAGAVGFVVPVGEYVAHEVEVLLHEGMTAGQE